MKNKKSLLPTIAVILGMIVVIFASGLIYDGIDLRRSGFSFERAKVVEVISENLREDRTISDLHLGAQEIEIEILSGAFRGETHRISNPMGRTYNIHTQEGMKIIVSIYATQGSIESLTVYSYRRSHVIYLLICIFVIALLAVGRSSGLKAIISLVFTGVIILFFMIPWILKGMNPIIAAIISAALSTTVTFYLVSGISKKTLVATIGTVLGVTIAGAISFGAGIMAKLSGLTMSNSEQLMYIADETKLQVRGLMFAAILIASLGAIMDVGMSITSAAFEIYRVNNKLTKRELFQSAMNVGRDIIGTMSNTLILAFTGGLLNLLIIFMAFKAPHNQIINMDIIAVEMVQAFAGSIGIVLTVPITALVASVVLKHYIKNPSNIIKNYTKGGKA